MLLDACTARRTVALISRMSQREEENSCWLSLFFLRLRVFLSLALLCLFTVQPSPLPLPSKTVLYERRKETDWRRTALPAVR